MTDVFGHKYELYIRQPTELIEIHNGTTGYEGNPVALLSPTAQVVNIRTGLSQTANNRGTSLSGNTTSSNTGYSDYLTVDPGSLLIKNPIQMEAKIKASTGKSSNTPNTAEIKLYNLSTNTLNQINAENVVLLKAGYETDTILPVLYVGTILKVYTERSGQDNITTLICKEADSLSKSAKINDKIPKGTTYNFLIRRFITKFKNNGIPLGYFQEIPRINQATEESLTFNGLLTKQFTEVTDAVDYIWFISRGKLYVQPRELDRPFTYVDIKPQNVIGAIKPYDDKASKTSKDATSKPKGVNVSTFLNADIGIESYIKIGYGQYQGDYKPEEVEYSLNWKDGPWKVDIKCQGVKTLQVNQEI